MPPTCKFRQIVWVFVLQLCVTSLLLLALPDTHWDVREQVHDNCANVLTQIPSEEKRKFWNLEPTYPNTPVISVMIRTFERPLCLVNLLDSIERQWEDAFRGISKAEVQILVVDDSKNNYDFDFDKYSFKVDYYRASYDLGIGRGRNLMLSQAQAKYILNLDDDYEFTPRSKIHQMLNILETDDSIDLIAGVIDVTPYAALLKLESHPGNRTLRFQPKFSRGKVANHTDCKFVDIGTQFWLARTEKIRMVGGWDNYIKALDHEDFYFNLIFGKNDNSTELSPQVRSPVSVVSCNSIRVHHYRNSPYKAKWVDTRGRALLEYAKLLDKYKLDAIVDIVQQTITKETLPLIWRSELNLRDKRGLTKLEDKILGDFNLPDRGVDVLVVYLSPRENILQRYVSRTTRIGTSGKQNIHYRYLLYTNTTTEISPFMEQRLVHERDTFADVMEFRVNTETESLIELLKFSVSKLSRVSFLILLKNESNFDLSNIISTLRFEMREDTVYACLPASEDTLYTSISEEHPTVLPVSIVKWFATSSVPWKMVGCAHDSLSLWLAAVGMLRNSSELCEFTITSQKTNNLWLKHSSNAESQCDKSDQPLNILLDAYNAFDETPFFLIHSSLANWKSSCTVQGNLLEIGVSFEHLLAYEIYTAKLKQNGYECKVYGTPDFGLQLECSKYAQIIRVHSFYFNQKTIWYGVWWKYNSVAMKRLQYPISEFFSTSLGQTKFLIPVNYEDWIKSYGQIVGEVWDEWSNPKNLDYVYDTRYDLADQNEMQTWGKNLLLNPSFEIDQAKGLPQSWTIMSPEEGKPAGVVSLSKSERHQGDFSIQITNSGESDVTGIFQEINLDQKEAEDIFISGWSKSRTNTALAALSPDYSIYVDIWNQDGSNTWGEVAEFTQEDSGDWIYSSHVIRNQKGTVYFDDLSVRRKSTGCKNQCEDKGSCIYQVCRCFEPFFGSTCGNKKNY